MLVIIVHSIFDIFPSYRRDFEVVLTSADNDYEFRSMFEKVYPDKVVDARLVKFSPNLTAICQVFEMYVFPYTHV